MRECVGGARLRRLQLLNSCQTAGCREAASLGAAAWEGLGRGATWLRLNTIRSGREAVAGANTSVRPLEGPASSMKSGGVPVPVCSNAGRSTKSSDDRFGIVSAALTSYSARKGSWSGPPWLHGIRWAWPRHGHGFLDVVFSACSALR